MSERDITLLAVVHTIIGTKGRLYYYQGNFYMPLLLRGDQNGLVKKAIRLFKRENRALIESDRAHRGYMTLVEIFDDQMTNTPQLEN